VLLGRGALDFINNTIDQTTGTIKLKARFDNQKHALWPGQFLQVRVVTSAEPARAIRQNFVQDAFDGRGAATALHTAAKAAVDLVRGQRLRSSSRHHVPYLVVA
jgi:multidrug efflux pump subunit AcrA (membrane-fusion protein)